MILTYNTMVTEMLQKEFLCDIELYFYSVKISFYSIKYTYMISKYIFIFLLYEFFIQHLSSDRIWSSIFICKSQNFTFSM